MKVTLVLAALVALVAAAPAPLSGTPTTPDVADGANKLCGPTSTAQGGGYIVNNNLWGAYQGQGQQCTTVDHISSKGVSWSTTWKWAENPTLVKSYANSGLIIGGNPKHIGDINKMPTSVQWDYKNAKGIIADVSYDLFTASDPHHAPSSGDYELMIWLAKYGNPSDIQPIGNKVGSGIKIGGHEWELWNGVGAGTSMRTFSFVASGGAVKKWNGDVKEFFDHLAKTQNYPAHNQYPITFQFGTEPKVGGEATLKVTDWSASIH